MGLFGGLERECLIVADVFPWCVFPQHGTGQVDLREYVIALSMVHRPFKGLDTIKLGFRVSL